MTTTLKLASHFPRSKGCEKQAQTFFDCFSTASETVLNTRETATTTGSEYKKVENNTVLRDCKATLNLYDSCMVKALQKYPEKYSRAGAAYRGRA